MKKLLLLSSMMILSSAILAQVLNQSKQQELYKLIQSLRSTGNVCIGFNETVKAVNAGRALLVIIADDAVPKAITDPLPVLCESKGVDYVYVSSKSALGKASKLQTDVISEAICLKGSEDAEAIMDKINKALK